MSFLICLLSVSLTQSSAVTDWQPLFNGKNYAGFTFWITGGPESTFFVEDGCMVIRGHTAGITYTRQKYRNYELRYDWKFDRPSDLTDDREFTGNSGAFLHLSRILKNWPRSVEVEGKYPDMGKLIAHEKVRGQFQDHSAAREAARKPVGQWNTTLVKCHEGHITVTINGQLVAEGQLDAEERTNPWEGAIGFQAQGATIRYRNIHIRELK